MLLVTFFLVILHLLDLVRNGASTTRQLKYTVLQNCILQNYTISEYVRSSVECQVLCNKRSDCVHYALQTDTTKTNGLRKCLIGSVENTTTVSYPGFTVYKAENVCEYVKGLSCYQNWTMLLETDAIGDAFTGNKDALLCAVKTGARVQVIVDGLLSLNSTYSMEMKTTSVIQGNNVCGQHVFSVGVESNADVFVDTAYWRYILICTSGHVHIKQHLIGSGDVVSESKMTIKAKWFVKPGGSAERISFYRNEADGSFAAGDTSYVNLAIHDGATSVRIVTEDYVNYDADYIELDSGRIQAQSVFRISEIVEGNHAIFPNSSLWEFIFIVSNGRRDNLHCGIESPVTYHGNDLIGASWYADRCWTKKYQNDIGGQQLFGSLPNLISAILSGHSVIWYYADRSMYADYIWIHNNQVTVQSLSHVSRTSYVFQNDPYWYFTMISTTGTYKVARFRIGQPIYMSSNNDLLKTTWYTDTRLWQLAFSHDTDGNTVEGSHDSLVYAVKSGADVRLVIPGNYPNEYAAFSAHNVEIRTMSNGTEYVLAQTVRRISITRPTDNTDTNWIICTDGSSVFTLITSYGKKDEMIWKLGDHVMHSHQQTTTAASWFVNY